MVEEHVESKCGSCAHWKACEAWMRHGSTLYSDFSYSVEDCPHYVPASDVAEVVRCKDCFWSRKQKESEYHIICELNDYAEFPISGYCSYGERADEM